MLEWTQVQAAARQQRETVEAVLRRRELSPRRRERVEMVKAVALGYGPEAIATWSGRSVRTVSYWLERFVTSGLGALADAPRVGRPPRASPTYLAALEAAVSTPPRALGLEFDVWTSERLSAYLVEQTGIRLSPGWLRVLLAQRDWVSGRPKLSVRHLRNTAEVAACEDALQVAEKKGGHRFGAPRVALDQRHAATRARDYPGLRQWLRALQSDEPRCPPGACDLAARAPVGPLLPQLNKKEREWRILKRDTRSHLAHSLRQFADEILAGLRRLGGERLDIVDRVPDWFLQGHRRPPRPHLGRPKGAKDLRPRARPRKNLPANT